MACEKIEQTFGLLAQHKKEEAAMQLVEQHVISRDDPRFAVIDEAAFKSKNLYNYANYIIRQKFVFEGVYLNYQTMDKLMQSHETYKALPTKVSQQVLKLLHKNWVSFFEACKAYKECPEKFTGRPKLPKYKHKTEGRNILVFSTAGGVAGYVVHPLRLAVSTGEIKQKA